MLEIRPNCEQCGKSLTSTSLEAMICSFECTYCKACALTIFNNVCPSCGGNFVPRPIRPKVMIIKYPASLKEVLNKKSSALISKMRSTYETIKPEER